MELWRASTYIFFENFLVGVGRYNFSDAIQKFVGLGLINEKAAHIHGHPHNVFFEAMSAKGIFGLVFVLMLYFYPLYVFFKTRNISRDSAFSGILLMVVTLIFSLTEVAPVYFGNFVSVFTIFLVVIFSRHIKCCYENTN